MSLGLAGGLVVLISIVGTAWWLTVGKRIDEIGERLDRYCK